MEPVQKHLYLTFFPKKKPKALCAALEREYLLYGITCTVALLKSWWNKYKKFPKTLSDFNKTFQSKYSNSYEKE